MKRSHQPKSALQLTQSAIELLRTAAKNEKAWKKAMRDPLGFLSENDHPLPGGSELTLYEADWNTDDLSFHVSELDLTQRNRSDSAPRNRVPIAGDPPNEPISCPPGQRPFKTIRRETICVKRGFYQGPIEWVTGGGDPRYGHWERQSTEICLQWLDTEVSVWECRPLTLKTFDGVVLVSRADPTTD
jgi:hypothetical protein